MNPDVMK
jgi:hypothetical protein